MCVCALCVEWRTGGTRLKVCRVVLFSKMTSQIVQEASAVGAVLLPEVTPIVDHGVGSIDSVQPVVESNIPSASPPQAVFPSNPLGEFLTRPALIGGFTINAATPVGTLVQEFFPIDQFFSNATIAPKVQNYHLFSGEVEVEVVITVPSGAYGMGILMALPQPDDPSANTFTRLPTSLSNCRQLDISVQVDFSRGGTYKIRLPWRFWYDKSDFSTGQYRKWWRLGLMMLSPLQSSFPGATVTASGRVFVKALPGFDLCVTRRQGKFSAGARKVAAAASAFADFPVVGEAAKVAAGAASAAASIAAYFGYTRDNDEKPPQPMFHKALTNVAHCEGTDCADVTALTREALVSSDPVTCWMPDDTHLEFASLFRRPTYIAGFTVTPATVVDTNLMVIPVTPFVVDPSATPSTGVSLTVPGYIGLPFARWRGTLNFHIQVYSSTIHSGRIAAFWSPNGDVTPSASDYTSLANHVWDLADATEHVLCVSHAQAIPFLQSDLVALGSPGTAGRNTNGVLVVRLLTPFIPQEPSNTITVRVFLSAGADMDFRLPRMTARFANGDLIPLEGQVTLQGGPNSLGSEEPTQAVCVELVGPGGSYPAEALNFPGQTARSVRALAQKPSEIKEGLAEDEVYGEYDFDPGFQEMKSKPRPECFLWDSYYLAPFLGNAASTRLQVVAPDRYSVAVSVSEGYEFNEQGGAKSVQNTGDPRGGSFMLPYASPQRFIFGSPSDTGAQVTKQFLTVQPEKFDGVNSFLFNLYRSAGEDLRVGMFRQIPLVQWETAVNPQKGIYWISPS